MCSIWLSNDLLQEECTLSNCQKKIILKNKIRNSRSKLDSLLSKHDSYSAEVLELSQKLDKLILQYYNMELEGKYKDCK